MDLAWVLQTLDFAPILAYLGGPDIIALSLVDHRIHQDLGNKPFPFWQQIAQQSGYPYRLEPPRRSLCQHAGLPAFGRATRTLLLRFMRHPHRNFVAHLRATFRDLSAPALNCIQRRNANLMFLVRTGPGFGRMRPVQSNRTRIADVVGPGDLIQVLPTNAAFIVYDRGAFPPTTDLVDEIGDNFGAPIRTPLRTRADPMADLFPMIVRYLRSGRPWSILFNDPDGPPSLPVQMICSRRSSKRRVFKIQMVHWTNMTPTFDELENYLRQNTGQNPRPCPETQLYPLLRSAMDPPYLNEPNYVYIWSSYDRFWFQITIHPVNRPWQFPIASFPTLHALFTELQDLQLVHDS